MRLLGSNSGPTHIQDALRRYYGVCSYHITNTPNRSECPISDSLFCFFVQAELAGFRLLQAMLQLICHTLVRSVVGEKHIVFRGGGLAVSTEQSWFLLSFLVVVFWRISREVVETENPAGITQLCSCIIPATPVTVRLRGNSGGSPYKEADAQQD